MTVSASTLANTQIDTIAARRFRAMGCQASVSIAAVDPDLASRLADRAVRRIAHLERCWTRFDEASDLSAINRAAGGAVAVDPSTTALIAMMVLAHRTTGGSCDSAHRSASPHASREIESIRVDEARHVVCVPSGLELDPGSIGKGLAADLVARQAIESGASGALVEIGGDVRATGVGPHHGFWSIAVEDPFGDSRRRGSILVREAGISTSGLATTPEVDGPENVSVDPVSGRPLVVAPTNVVSATVVAGSAVEAEMWSTALLVVGDAELESVVRRGYLARVTFGNGDTRSTDDWNRIFSPDDSSGEVAHV